MSFSIGSITIRYVDCIDGMKQLATGSVDLVFADPPYNINKNIANDNQTKQEYIAFSRAWLVEACRALKETGSIYVMCSVKYEPYIFQILSDEIGLDHVNTIAWTYTGNAHRVKHELIQNHESILFFTRSRTGKTFNMDDMRDPGRFSRFDKANDRRGKALTDVWDDITNLRWNNEERYKFYKKNARGNVIKKGHPTQKPASLVKRAILLSSDPGDAVLDPFVGSGTCPVACLETDRSCIGFEIDTRWKGMIETRLKNAFKKASTRQLDTFTRGTRSLDTFKA